MLTHADRELLGLLLDFNDELFPLPEADPQGPQLSPRERDAFRDMLERDFALSQKQREWVHEAALRLGIKDEPAENTFSGWSPAKQRRELAQAKRHPFEELPRPAKPPGRR